MGKGIVSLHDWDGTFIRSVIYDTPKDRREIVKSWCDMYQKRINRCYIIIKPFEVSIRMNRNGTNSKGKANFIRELVVEEP